MARISQYVAIAFFDTRAADLAAIEKLHKADVEATLTQDPALLTKLWSEGGDNFGLPGPPVVGIRDKGSAYAKFRAPGFSGAQICAVINEIQIVDEWAIEVGNFGGTFKMSAKDEPVTVQSTGMQQDGSWKFAIVGLK